jgi:hypothetical protein
VTFTSHINISPFSDKRTPIFSATLQQFYATNPNPFLVALKMYANSADHNNPKNNGLSFAIFDELNKFKKQYRPDTTHLLDVNLKMVAFNLTSDKGQSSFFKLITELYELIVSKDLFIVKIREMCQKHDYKEAGQIAFDLELFDAFDIYDFLLPLLFQDKHR